MASFFSEGEIIMQSRLKLILFGSATFLLGIIVGFKIKSTKRAIKRSETFDVSITFPHKSDAENVLLDLYLLLKQNGFVTASDLYNLSGIVPDSEHTAGWGWTDITNSIILETKDGGYELCLPSAELIK